MSTCLPAGTVHRSLTRSSSAEKKNFRSAEQHEATHPDKPEEDEDLFVVDTKGDASLSKTAKWRQKPLKTDLVQDQLMGKVSSVSRSCFHLSVRSLVE